MAWCDESRDERVFNVCCVKLVQQWSSKSVLEWMAAARLEPYIDIFRSREVTGEDLAALSVDRLRVSMAG